MIFHVYTFLDTRLLLDMGKVRIGLVRTRSGPVRTFTVRSEILDWTGSSGPRFGTGPGPDSDSDFAMSSYCFPLIDFWRYVLSVDLSFITAGT